MTSTQVKQGWQIVKLGKLLSKILGGGTPSKSVDNYWNGNVQWASVKDMEDGKYQLLDTKDRITKEGLKNSSANLIPKGTVVVSTRMGLGRCFIAKIDIAINQDLKALIPNSKLDNNFLLWLYASKSEEIEKMGSGTTVKGIRLEQLKNLDVVLPPLLIQQKIASILSAFDNLIESNAKRIKILENTAQLIYKEWFVDFKFPDYKKIKMVNSDTELGDVPDEWEVKKIKDIADINKQSIKKDDEIDYIDYVDIKSVKTGIIKEITPLSFQKAPSRARRVVKHGDIIWSTVRPNRKSYSLILKPSENLIVSTGFAVLTPKALPFSYLYPFVTTDNFVGYLVGNATGSAYPAVSSETFKNANILVPSQNVINSFNEISEPIHNEIKELGETSKKLRVIRDLLLPKLIGGEIEINNLKIQ